MKPNIQYGLILGGILIAISLLIYVLGLEKDETVTTVSGIINIAVPAIVTFLGIRELRDKYQHGFISFGQGFSCGLVISIIGGALSSIYSFLYFKVINPGMLAYIRLKQEQEMLDRGMSDSDIEKMSGTMDFWTNPAMMSAFAFLGMVILGLVISLISAAILKKEDPAAMIS
ncbi:MAG: DUF4199 domain-containing protein [Bacteroidetes bacterium]|nr:DUF4199 domain-containing protein [Bacteroidota bacterium]